jgi:hypothetical protein
MSSNNNSRNNNSEVLTLLKAYIKTYGGEFSSIWARSSQTIEIENYMSVNNTSLLTFGKELHSISLRDYPTTHSNNKSANYNKKRKLPLVVFEDYPECKEPIMYNISSDAHMINNDGLTEITYMMYYCLPHVNKYEHALHFFTRSTCGPLLSGPANITPFEINYPAYFNHRGTLYRKLASNTPDRAGRWNVIHLLSCLRIESINYNDGKELFRQLCSHSIQSSDTIYPTNIIDLNIVINSMTPISRILSSLDYKMLPFFHPNTYDVLLRTRVRNDVDDFRDRTRPLYINILIYYRNIDRKINGISEKTTLPHDSLLGGKYIAPNIELLDILLDYNIDIDKADIEIDVEIDVSPIDFCCFKGYYTCLEVFLQKRPELFKESSHYLKLISDGLKKELNKFFSDENMEQLFNKLEPDSPMRYRELVADILIDNIMDDFNFLQEFLDFDKFSEILDPYVGVKKIDFINTFAMKYLHSMISSFINTYKLIKNKSGMNKSGMNVFNNSINVSKILSKFIDEANYRNITNVTKFKEFVKKWQKYNNNNNISDTDLNTLLRNGEPLRKKLDSKLKRVKPLRNIANKKNIANLVSKIPINVSKIPINVSQSRRVFENTNNTYSLDYIVLQNLMKIGESIDYRHVTETQYSLTVNDDYLDGLRVLQEFDRNIVNRITNSDDVEKILKHVIKSSNSVVRESKYKPKKEIVSNSKIIENFFDTIKIVKTGSTFNISLSNAGLFLKIVLRFQRLSYILCMNPTLLNNLIDIGGTQMKVIDWYSFVYNNFVTFGTQLTGHNKKNNKKKNILNHTLLNENLEKIQKLHQQCISNFTKFNNLKPVMELTSYGGSSKKYIKLQKGGKRLIRTGGRGGRYYMKGGNKIYIK